MAMKISFGQLFQHTDAEFVVVDVGEKNYFYVAKITPNEEGQRDFSLQTGIGTSYPEDVDKLGKKLSFREMLSAAMWGALRVDDRHLDRDEIARLRELSAKGEREV